MLKLILLEYLRKADETLEIYQGRCNNIWVYNNNGHSLIFQEGQDFMKYYYGGSSHVKRKGCATDHLNRHLKEAKEYDDINLQEVGADG